MEHIIKQHGPASLAILSLVLTGGLINHPPPNVNQVNVDHTWCKPWNNNNNTLMTDMPPAIGPLAITASIVLPLVPLVLNSKLIWSDYKTEILKSHFLGQSASFGVAELFRHYATMPNQDFMQKCNVTFEQCETLSIAKLPLYFYPVLNETICKQSDSNKSEVFDNLHNFPNVTCSLLGASLVSFAIVILYWHNVNKQGKSIYQANSVLKILIVALQCLLVIILFMYLYYLYKKLEFMHLLSVFLGAGVQLFISVSMIRQEQNTVTENQQSKTNQTDEAFEML